MNPANLSAASRHYARFLVSLREAYTDAINAGEPFAEIVIYSLLGPAHGLERELGRALLAATESADTPATTQSTATAANR
jgi:hypothetical protein